MFRGEAVAGKLCDVLCLAVACSTDDKEMDSGTLWHTCGTDSDVSREEWIVDVEEGVDCGGDLELVVWIVELAQLGVWIVD